jgi:hypothetical protein
MTDTASTTDRASDKAQELKGQASEKAQEAAGQAKGQLRGQVDQRSTEAGQRVNTTAGDLRSVAESLRSEGKDQPARFAEQAAERVERVGGYLERSDADRILADVEEYARRQPWVVGLGAAAIGFAAARFLKASSDQRYRERTTTASRELPAGNGSSRPVPPPVTPGTTGVPGYTAPITSTGTPPDPLR